MADAPDSLFACKALTFGARALGALLWRYASHDEARPFVFPATRTLAEDLNTDPRVVRRLMAELKALGFAVEAQRKGDAGQWRRGWYLNRAPDLVPERPISDPEGRTPVSGEDSRVRTPASGADSGVLAIGLPCPDAEVRGGLPCPPDRTPVSGQADSGVLRSPIESPLNPKREAPAHLVDSKTIEPTEPWPLGPYGEVMPNTVAGVLEHVPRGESRSLRDRWRAELGNDLDAIEEDLAAAMRHRAGLTGHRRKGWEWPDGFIYRAGQWLRREASNRASARTNLQRAARAPPGYVDSELIQDDALQRMRESDERRRKRAAEYEDG
jgi:hypothetical protein